jgi:hypothetical protein
MIHFFQPLLPQPPSRHGLEENSEERTISESGGRIRTKCSFPKILAVQERYLQQAFRYSRGESSNSADDRPRLLNALSS